jgi:hypothetical protein
MGSRDMSPTINAPGVNRRVLAQHRHGGIRGGRNEGRIGVLVQRLSRAPDKCPTDFAQRSAARPGMLGVSSMRR